MACCAFAVFLLLNLLAPLGWLRRSRGSPDRRSNPAVAWRYGHGDVVRSTAPSLMRWRRAVAGAVALEVLALAALGAYLLLPAGLDRNSGAEDWEALIALHTSWCRSDGVRANPNLTLAER